MDVAGKKIGFALTGSHCTLEQVLPEMKRLVDLGAEVQPILSEAVQTYKTRFGTPQKWREEVTKITGNKPWTSISEVEPIGPRELLDILIVAPCTGNTIAKIVNGITDTTVVMAVKAHLRNSRATVLAVATNDALGNNAANIGKALNIPNLYLVPLGQDNPTEKPNSLVARMDLVVETTQYALEGKQLQPVIIEYKGI
ncbi:dipicolinate synthase subunit B [Natroniella sulfidigena]|uniref:dipicolinate synthase subunit B n=1 Tax=Natroniella sulfidigena TaxID=723921 RepID=UPI002009FBB5|nr:dipicolinate synthase subunit B [Natroniella sulfidigena]